jgi:hypothetical protein
MLVGGAIGSAPGLWTCVVQAASVRVIKPSILGDGFAEAAAASMLP